jgi:hypothetical protein
MADEVKVEEKNDEVAAVKTPAVESEPVAATDNSNHTTVNVNVANPATVKEKRKVNWVLTLILSILVGSIGVDRFLMGQVGWGILKLITFGGFGIWWIIDIILIATKHQFSGIEWIE